MRVYIYSPFFEISALLSEKLHNCKDKFIPFHKLDDLIDTVKNSIIPPGLIILDYLSINHDLFNCISHLTSMKSFTPFIFYNDPCLTKKDRIDHWKNVITKVKYCPKDLSYLDVILEKIQSIIESDEYKKYIPLMSLPEKLPLSMIQNMEYLSYIKENSESCIKDFQERNNLPSNLFYLLSILQNYGKEKPMTYDEIRNKYIEDNKKMSIESLKVLMSQLRSIIRKDKNCNFLISKFNKSYRFVFYKHQ